MRRSDAGSRFHTLAAKRSDPNDRLIGERMIATSHHYLGDLISARLHLERVLAALCRSCAETANRSLSGRPVCGGATILPGSCGCRGLPDQAMRDRRKQCRGRSGDRSCNLAGSALSAWRHARSRCSWAIWPRRNITWKCCSIIRQGMRWRAGAPSAAAIRECSSSSAAISASDYGCCAPVSTNQARPGPSRGSLRSLWQRPWAVPARSPTGLPRSRRRSSAPSESEERWATAELLRIKGELFLLQGAPGAAAAAEGQFQQALDWARRQGALSWELRCATSLARLWRNQARTDEARELLGAGL